MNKNLNNMYKFILIVLLILLSGCTSSQKKNNKEEQFENFYSEKEIKLPETDVLVKDINSINNKIYLSTENTESKEITMWSLSNKDTWQEEYKLNDILLSESLEFVDVKINSLGESLITNYTNGTDNSVEMLYFINEKKEVTEKKKIAKYMKDKEIEYLSFFSNEILLGVTHEGEFYTFNIDNEDIISTFSTGYELIQSVAIGQEDVNILNIDNNIKTFNISDGTEEKNKKQISLVSEDLRNKQEGYSNNVIFRMNEKIFSFNSKGVTEYNEKSSQQIIKGNDTLFGSSTYSIQKAYVPTAKKMVVLFRSDKDNKLMSYEYDEKNNVSKKELKIYSLYENDFLKEAINTFSRQNKEININYEIGLNVNSSVSETDALKKLNTDILSNNGPDVLVMDGLNIDNYINQNLLSEIEISNDNNLLLGSNGKEKKYIVPSRVNLAVFNSSENIILEDNMNIIINSIETSIDNSDIPKFKEEDLYNGVSIMYHSNFSDIELFTENNILDFFEVVKKIKDMSVTAKGEHGSRMINDLSTNNYYFNTLEEISNAEVKYSLDYITNLIELRDREYLLSNGMFGKTISNNKDETLIKTGVMAISSKSNKKELSNNFINSVLSVDYQSQSIYYGIPVNKDAFAKLVNEIPDSSYKNLLSKNSKEKLEFSGFKNYEEKVKNLEKLTQSIPSDIIIKKIMINELENMLKNDMNPKESASKAYKKITLYKNEK